MSLQRGTGGEPGQLRTVTDSWLNATHSTVRSLNGETTEYTVRDRLVPPESLVWPGPVLRTFQDSAQAFAVTAVEQRNATQFVTLSTTGDSTGSGPAETNVTLVVDEHGTIHSLEATTDYGGGESYRVTYTVDQVGDVTPDPPAWLADVPDGASLTASLFTGMGPEGVIQLEHVGGDTVPAGTFVTVLGNDSLSEARLADPLQSGETLYVFVAPDTGELRVTTTEPAPGEYDPVPREFTVRVLTPDGIVLHEERLGWEPLSEN